MKWEQCRPGQKGAIQTIIDQYIAGAQFTPIILPTRYGKTDVIRVSSFLLWEEGYMPCALAMAPYTTLRKQINDEIKWEECRQRFGLNFTDFNRRALTKPEIAPNKNGEVFLSATTQLVNSNKKEVFATWVESVARKTGKRPLIFVDECHTGSEDNSWGDAAKMLADAGAHVVLLTATAIRSDGKIIPGFDFEIIDESTFLRTKIVPDVNPVFEWVETSEITKRHLRLIAKPPMGWETTFQEAWDEIPSPICKVSFLPFDINLRGFSLSGDTNGYQWISKMDSKPEIRRILGKLLKTTIVIEGGVHRMIESLKGLHEIKRDIGVIVFCGNDDEKEDQRSINKHANAIREVIEMAAPHLTVVIATSENDGEKKIEEFLQGYGDVLIVKQMAGVGLDIPRVKVILDLSPVRTPASFIQRIMRAATPYYGFITCTYIGPDDILSRDMFNDMVQKCGGEASASDMELVDRYKRTKTTGPGRDKTLYDALDTGNAAFEDSNQNYASAEEFPTVEAILKAYPILSAHYSHAEIAVQASSFSITPKDSQPTSGKSRDIGKTMDMIKREINVLARSITGRRIDRGGYDKEEFGDIIKDVFIRTYREVGIPQGQTLDKINDISALQAILKSLQMLGGKEDEIVFEFEE